MNSHVLTMTSRADNFNSETYPKEHHPFNRLICIDYRPFLADFHSHLQSSTNFFKASIMPPLLRICLARLPKSTPSSSLSASSSISRARHLSTSAALRYPRKDSEDRESMSINPTEYSKSGSDGGAAQQDVAFKPGNTKPEEAMDKAEKEVYHPSDLMNREGDGRNLG